MTSASPTVPPPAQPTQGEGKRLYAQLADKISAGIGDGTFPPGQRLPSERDLSEHFAVSRATIREALIALEIMGLISVRPGSGLYVLPPTQRKPAPQRLEDQPGPYEVLECRLLLESDAARLAATRIGNDELHQLQALLARLATAIEQTDPEAAERSDRDFHLLIAQATRNNALHSMIEWLWSLRQESELSVAFHQKLRLSGSLPTYEDHEAILQALMRRDPDGAYQASYKHLSRVTEEFDSTKLA